jgi:CheY-like chemotaxis protein
MRGVAVGLFSSCGPSQETCRAPTAKGALEQRECKDILMTKKRILVIDDEQVSREGVGEVLEEEGYEVALGADGQEAVALLSSFLPDLVLTDLQMPGLDGIGVLNHVRNMYPITPVIIFTADITIDAKRTAERLGVRDYINKPLDFTDLLMRVARALTPEG